MEESEQIAIAKQRERSRVQFSIRSILIATLFVAAFCCVGQVVWQSYIGPLASRWFNLQPQTLPSPYYLYDDVLYDAGTSAPNNETQRGDEPMESTRLRIVGSQR